MEQRKEIYKRYHLLSCPLIEKGCKLNGLSEEVIREICREKYTLCHVYQNSNKKCDK